MEFKVGMWVRYQNPVTNHDRYLIGQILSKTESGAITVDWIDIIEQFVKQHTYTIEQANKLLRPTTAENKQLNNALKVTIKARQGTPKRLRDLIGPNNPEGVELQPLQPSTPLTSSHGGGTKKRSRRRKQRKSRRSKRSVRI
jgi:hypothetical protein